MKEDKQRRQTLLGFTNLWHVTRVEIRAVCSRGWGTNQGKRMGKGRIAGTMLQSDKRNKFLVFYFILGILDNNNVLYIFKILEERIWNVLSQ